MKSGNIVEQKCDAIVNSTNERLDLSRGMFIFLFSNILLLHCDNDHLTAFDPGQPG